MPLLPTLDRPTLLRLSKDLEPSNPLRMPWLWLSPLVRDNIECYSSSPQTPAFCCLVAIELFL